MIVVDGNPPLCLLCQMQLGFLADSVPYTTYLIERNTNLEIVPLAQLQHRLVNMLLPQFREREARYTSP
jgi:hypothetical protein